MLTTPIAFVAIDPCRVVDTRGNGFVGEWGPPALATTQTRTFTIGDQCGIRVSAQAVSVQFTAVKMTSNGNFRAWPGGGSMPTASVICSAASPQAGFSPSTLDSTGDVGSYTSVTIGSDSLGLVSYRDVTNGDLKVAHCSNALCTPYVRRR